MKYGNIKILLVLSLLAQGASALSVVEIDENNGQNIDKTCLKVPGDKVPDTQRAEQQSGISLQGVRRGGYLCPNPEFIEYFDRLEYWQTCIHSRILNYLESESPLAFEEVWELVTDNCMSKVLQLADSGSLFSFVKVKEITREAMAKVWRQSTGTE